MKAADSSPTRSRQSVQTVISNTRSFSNEVNKLSLKHTARGSFPSLALEYKGYNLGPEYIMARRMKEYLYYPGRTADVDGVIPDYLCNEFERLYTTMKRPSPMRSPPVVPMPEKRMIDVARTMFDRERVRRPASARIRSCNGSFGGDFSYHHHSEDEQNGGIASMHPSPVRSPAWRDSAASASYPDSIPFVSQSYNDPVRDDFLSALKENHEDQQNVNCFRITADRTLPCPTTNAAVASLIYLTRRFYKPGAHNKNQTRNQDAA